MNKTIGIVGGMGPLATCDLYQKIIQVTQADKDQEHVRVCIDGNTRIPDRTAAILHKGRDPLPQMIKSAVRLEGMGADVLIMPCNTAHYFYKKLLPFVDIPFLNMLEETADAAVKMGITKAGLLATDGTVKSGVYEKAFQERGISLELPAKEEQESVMELIYDGVKAGNYSLDTKKFERAMDKLLQRGAQVLVLGCTELPVAFQRWKFTQPALDPTLVLASKAVQFVGVKVKEQMRF